MHERLGGYVKFATHEDMQAAIKELKEREGLSNREVADVIGVDEKTVRRKIAANAAAEDENTNDDNGSEDETAANAAPAGVVEEMPPIGYLAGSCGRRNRRAPSSKGSLTSSMPTRPGSTAIAVSSVQPMTIPRPCRLTRSASSAIGRKGRMGCGDCSSNGGSGRE